MDQHLTPAEAWNVFWVWIKQHPNWRTMSRKEKQYLDKTNRAVLNGDAKALRIKRILEEYAEGCFVFHPGEPYFIRA